MKHNAQEQRLVSRWALPGSVAVHVLVVLLVIFGLPLSLLEPNEEQAINVELVPPAKPPGQPKAEQPPSPPEKPKQPEQAKKPPPQAPDKPAPQAVINPVFQFGEKDAGPRDARDGRSAEDGAAAEAERELEKQEQLKELQKPKEPPALTASKSQTPAPQPDAPEKPVPKPSEAVKNQEAAKPKEAKKLSSQKKTGDVQATVAMADVPRGVRAGRLCVTELRDQLRNGFPPYYPDLLPSSKLEDDATVIDEPNVAFRVNGEWFDLSYRCQVDKNATRVMAFTFRVGDLLTPAERRQRGLPSR